MRLNKSLNIVIHYDTMERAGVTQFPQNEDAYTTAKTREFYDTIKV
jgi:hypothetical protein